ncbi:hypothetical protein CLF_109120 [Clonorchis sinensis]|uniref:Uncharacterized protein n=1 Tax=Clonorchis sinensis TaxID=79923 RepID=G7YS98_CLOSI|nr:hypothetical protein CLF_109120 [Clonorchis sinensis]
MDPLVRQKSGRPNTVCFIYTVTWSSTFVTLDCQRKKTPSPFFKLFCFTDIASNFNTYWNKSFCCSVLLVPNCYATRRKHEGWDIARLLKSRQKSRKAEIWFEPRSLRSVNSRCNPNMGRCNRPILEARRNRPQSTQPCTLTSSALKNTVKTIPFRWVLYECIYEKLAFRFTYDKPNRFRVKTTNGNARNCGLDCKAVYTRAFYGKLGGPPPNQTQYKNFGQAFSCFNQKRLTTKALPDYEVLTGGTSDRRNQNSCFDCRWSSQTNQSYSSSGKRFICAGVTTQREIRSERRIIKPNNNFNTTRKVDDAFEQPFNGSVILGLSGSSSSQTPINFGYYVCLLDMRVGLSAELGPRSLVTDGKTLRPYKTIDSNDQCIKMVFNSSVILAVVFLAKCRDEERGSQDSNLYAGKTFTGSINANASIRGMSLARQVPDQCSIITCHLISPKTVRRIRKIGDQFDHSFRIFVEDYVEKIAG